MPGEQPSFCEDGANRTVIMTVPEANVHGITEMFDNLVRGAQDERKTY